ncbi:hypothetical protein BpHYR1_046998 [Brachionus plicatilis]|uniref:Uncharacterized protein n=1 Tax=Brachionus plicatilis TaxID=10195 RepID=A0A3M7SE46_BRAPC|nr:hypothetical protein BpHYR1_046998 [Brachionus plicatilis]
MHSTQKLMARWENFKKIYSRTVIKLSLTRRNRIVYASFAGLVFDELYSVFLVEDAAAAIHPARSIS